MRENNILWCCFDHTIPSETHCLLFSAHSWWLLHSIRDNRIGADACSILGLHVKKKPPRKKEHTNTLICLIRDANLSRDNRGMVGVSECTSSRWSLRWVAWNTHNSLTHTRSKWHGHTRHCARPLTITRTRLVLCLRRLVVLSLQPAPPQLQPLAPKRERGLNGGPRHNLGYSLRDGTRGRWDNAISCLQTSVWCNVSRRRNAQGQRGGTNGDQSKVCKAQVNPPERNRDGKSRTGERAEYVYPCSCPGSVHRERNVMM